MPGQSKEAASLDRGGQMIMIIDAGHGIPDGGAVSDSGVTESSINLAIAKKLEAIAKFCGAPCVMTRKDENSIHSGDADTIRKQKVSDMKNRVTLVNSYDNAILISIHQNSYSKNAKGAQVFFRKEDQISMNLAAAVQEYLRLALNQGNDRKPAVIPKRAYLFKNTTCPAIIVECGFLSNREEALQLQEDTYQIKAVLAVISAYLHTEAQ